MKNWIAGIIILCVVGLWAKSEISSYHTPNLMTNSTLIATPALTSSDLNHDFNAPEFQPINLSYQIGHLAPSDKTSIQKQLVPLINHLKDNNHKVITIKGGFVSKESKIGVGGFSNFGEARAGYIKRELEKANIARSRISIKGQLLTSNPKQFLIEFLLNTDPELDK